MASVMRYIYQVLWTLRGAEWVLMPPMSRGASFRIVGSQANQDRAVRLVVRNEGLRKMELGYTAPDHVRRAITSLDRTEDVRFSPNNRRLAVSSFMKHTLALFDISISGSPAQIVLTNVVEFSSHYLRYPHNIEFITDSTIIVANRGSKAGESDEGSIAVFELPPSGQEKTRELKPVEVMRSRVLNSPGNVSIIGAGQNRWEMLICDNFGNKVTRHILDLNTKPIMHGEETLLRKWLSVPCGISVSEPWIAISNHAGGNVLLYQNTEALSEDADPEGILRGLLLPHGVRFASDGRFLLVADAAAPFVQIYRNDDFGWHGVRGPVKSVKVVKDSDFLRGKALADDGRQGGPKGLDVDRSANVLVTTCELQPLAFFDLGAILESLSLPDRGHSNSPPRSDKTIDLDPIRLDLNYELEKTKELIELRDRELYLSNKIAALCNSRSWQITAPMRSIGAFLRSRFHRHLTT